VLDEVDAALDETNVGRLADLLHARLSQDTQFLMVTHSKRMMQTADMIYGVTMQEPGVSKIVSVHLGGRLFRLSQRCAVAEVANRSSSQNAASRDLLNPLASPGGRLEGICEILRLVHDLTVAELHDAHCVCRSPLVGDCVFRDPEIAFSENSPDVEA
jgi:hypothetical protein